MEVGDFPRGPAPEPEEDLTSKHSHLRRSQKRRRPYLESRSLPTTTSDFDHKFRSLGAKAMGMVTEVYERYLRVALPHGIEEIIPAEEASDVLSMMLGDSNEGRRLRQLYGDPHSMTKLFTPGQYVHGSYLESDDGCRFSLKLCHFYDDMPASTVKEGNRLMGCVRTVEDHGYSLFVGIKGLSGFLRKSEATAQLDKDVALLPGRLVEGTVVRVSKGAIQLSLDAECSFDVSVENGPHEVLPGILVYAEIVRIRNDGMDTKFLNIHRGIITIFHIKEDLLKEGWKARFVEGQVVKAIVLAWDPIRAEYLLSLKPFLIDRQLPPMPAVLGQVFPNAIVHRIDPKGLSLKLPLQSHFIECYVSEDKLGDLPLLSRDFKLGQSIEVRATGFHAMEGLVVGSTKTSVIKSSIVCFKDLHPGMVSQGTVVRVFNDRVYVAVGDGIEGCARQCGYSKDTPLNKVFVSGQSVSYRVLNIKPEIRQVMLSLDGRLVHSSLPFLTSWEEAQEGMHVVGYVLAIKRSVVIVSFAGDVHGILPKGNTKLQESESLADVYQRHQVMNVWVHNIQPERRKIFLTTIKTMIDNKAIQDSSLQYPLMEICTAPPGLSPGDTAEAIVEKVLTEGQRYLIKYHTTETCIEGKAILSGDHLTDHPTDVHDPSLSLQEGQSIGKVIVLSVTGDVQVSMKPSLVDNAAMLPQRLEDVKKNMLLQGYVSKLAKDYLDVTFLENLTGRVFKNQTMMPSLPIDQQFRLAQSVDVRVIKVDMDRRRMYLKVQSNMMQSDEAYSGNPLTAIESSSLRLQLRDIVPATVKNLIEGGVSVRLNLNTEYQINAVVPFTDLFDNFVDCIPIIIQPGVAMRAVIIKKSGHGIVLSTRPSEGGSIDTEVELSPNACPLSLERDAVEIGMDIQGYVCGYGKTKPCLFVNVARDLVATVHAPHFADDPVEDIVQHFPLGTMVKGTLIACKHPKMGLSLRSGRVPLATVGNVKKGTVVSIQPQGIYVALRDSSIQGLIPRYDLLSHRSKIKAGQTIIVRIAPLTDAFHLYLEIMMDDRMEIDPSSEVMEIDEGEEEMDTTVDDIEFERCLAKAVQAETSNASLLSHPDSFPQQSSPSQQLKHIMWDDVPEETQLNVPEPDQLALSVDIKSEPESNIFSAAPKTAIEFERLLFSQPNSSYLWIRYAASFIESGDVSKARSTVERALDVIDLKKEKERLDIWLAYLNLERTQGGTTESIMSLFQRAVICNDPKKLHLAFLNVLEASKKTEIGDLLIKSMRRRCPGSAKTVIKEMHYWLSTGRGGHCKQTLEAALKQLPKRKQMRVILQAGILEFKLGIAERGREIFEGLLSCYPKRMDIWNVYLDQELAQADTEHARALFERVSVIDGHQKSMKWIFKRFLQFELEHGDDRSVQHVKDKAKAYIAKKTSRSHH